LNFNKKSKLSKEQWIFIELKEETYKKINIIAPPQKPPPRDFSELQNISDKIESQPITNS
jgi:hypothetical protein